MTKTKTQSQSQLQSSEGDVSRLRMFSVRLDRDLIQRTKVASVTRRLSLQDLVTQALMAALDSEKSPGS